MFGIAIWADFELEDADGRCNGGDSWRDDSISKERSTSDLARLSKLILD